MSKHQLISSISRELSAINEQIDWKVIKGMPYRREARRHKLLISMLQDIKRTSLQARGSSVFSFF